MVDFAAIELKETSQADRIVKHANMIKEFKENYPLCKEVRHLKYIHEWIVECDGLSNTEEVETYLSRLENSKAVLYNKIIEEEVGMCLELCCVCLNRVAELTQRGGNSGF